MLFEQLKKIPTEYEEQVRIFSWANDNISRFPVLKFLFSTLNGVKMPIGLALKCKRSGMKAGVPDLILPLPLGGFHGLFIELKRTKGGKVTPEQKIWGEYLSRNDYFYAVCEGADEAIQILKNYLSQGA